MSKRSKRHGDFNDRHPFTATKRVLHDLGRDDLISDPIRDPVNDKRVFHPDRDRVRLPVPSSTPMRDIRIYTRRRDQNLRRRGSGVNPDRVFRSNREIDFMNPSHWVENPRMALVCARRAIRRSVILSMFKKKGRGRGGGRFRDKHYNEDSTVRCRR